MQKAHIFVSGFVQGVGFRAFVKKEAHKLSIKGWVKNLSDNRVEILAEGSKEEIEKLAMLCEKGPFLSEVKDVTVSWVDDSSKLTGFEIIRS